MSNAQATTGAVPFGSGRPVRQPLIPATAVALSDAAEHEPPGELLGQFADGAPVPQSEVGVGPVDWLPDGTGGPEGHQPLPDAPL